MQILEAHTVVVGGIEYNSHPLKGVQVVLGHTQSGWSKLRPYGFDNLTTTQASSISLMARIDESLDTLTPKQKDIISSCIEELDWVSSSPSPKLIAV